MSETGTDHPAADETAVRGMRQRGRSGLLWLALIAAAVAAGAVKLAPDGARTASLAFASRAEQANDAGDHPKALLWALTGLPQPGELVSPDSAQARAQMLRAYSNLHVPRILERHTDGVFAASFSPDGKTIVTASRDGTAKLWDARTGTLQKTLAGHEGPVIDAAFGPAGKRVLTVSGEAARVWDVKTGKVLAVLKDKDGDIDDAEFDPAGARVVTAGLFGSVKLWDAQSGTLLHALELRRDSAGEPGVPANPDAESFAAAIVFDVAFSPDGRRIATGHMDGQVKIWNAETGKLEHTLTGPGYDVTRVIFSPSGDQVATAGWHWSGGRHGKAHLWDARTGERLCVFEGYDGPIRDLAFDPGDHLLATIAGNGQARLWDPKTCKPVRALIGSRGSGRDIPFGPVDFPIAFDPSGTHLLTVPAGNYAQFWDVKTGLLLETFAGHRGRVTAAGFSPDGRRLVTASLDGTARLWDVQPVNLVKVLKGKGGPKITVWAFDPSGKHLITASADGKARLWDAETGASGPLLSGHQGPVHDAAFDGSGAQVITVSEDRTAQVWNVETGEHLQTLKVENGIPSAAVLDASGARALVTSWDSSLGKPHVSLWDLKTGRKVNAFTLPDEERFASGRAAFSPRGARVLTSNFYDRRATLWNAETGEPLKVLTTDARFVPDGIFSRSGSHLITRATEDIARIRDAGTGARVLDLHLSEPVWTFLDFDWARKRLLVQYLATGLGVWDLGTGSLRHTLYDDEFAMFRGGFVGDSDYVFTASHRGRARLWDVRAETALTELPIDPAGELSTERLSGDSAVIDGTGTRIITVSGDNSVRLWRVPPILHAGPDEQIRMACALARRVGATEFPKENMRDPLLHGRARNPCSRPGLLSKAFYRKAIREWYGGKKE